MGDCIAHCSPAFNAYVAHVTLLTANLCVYLVYLLSAAALIDFFDYFIDKGYEVGSKIYACNLEF